MATSLAPVATTATEYYEVRVNYIQKKTKKCIFSKIKMILDQK
jgi:hypothetical protein